MFDLWDNPFRWQTRYSHLRLIFHSSQKYTNGDAVIRGPMGSPFGTEKKNCNGDAFIREPTQEQQVQTLACRHKNVALSLHCPGCGFAMFDESLERAAAVIAASLEFMW